MQLSRLARNEVNIDTFSGYLTAQGYRIILAQTGREAIDLAATEHPDAILMDLHMPDLDGIAAIEQLRQQLQHDRHPNYRPHRANYHQRPRSLSGVRGRSLSD